MSNYTMNENVKKLFTLPIMQARYANIEIEAYSEEEALEKFSEMDDYEVDYLFWEGGACIAVDETEEITFQVIGGVSKEGKVFN